MTPCAIAGTRVESRFQAFCRESTSKSDSRTAVPASPNRSASSIHSLQPKKSARGPGSVSAFVTASSTSTKVRSPHTTMLPKSELPSSCACRPQRKPQQNEWLHPWRLSHDRNGYLHQVASRALDRRRAFGCELRPFGARALWIHGHVRGFRRGRI